MVNGMKKRVEGISPSEQEELVSAIVQEQQRLSKLDRSSLRVVKESALVESVVKPGFDLSVVKEVVRDICIMEEGAVLGSKG